MLSFFKKILRVVLLIRFPTFPARSACRTEIRWLFEVTPEKEIVWEYVNPFFGPQQITQDKSPAVQGLQNSVFRAFRYTPEQIPWLKA
jgi:hypothetical protein